MSTFHPKVPRLICAVVNFAMWALLAASNDCRADIAAQSGPNPIVFDQTARTDNLVVLMAAGSEHTRTIVPLYSGPSFYPKHFWMKNWLRAWDYMAWNISLAQGADYRVFALLESGAAVPMTLKNDPTGRVLRFSTRNVGWDKLDAGTITLPAGTSRLVLQRATDGADVQIKSLELIKIADLPAYKQRVAAFKANTMWFSRSAYGLMFQMGPWGYPQTGTDRDDIEAFAKNFDVPKFVSMVKATGARHVIWSACWGRYQICAPLQSVNTIAGNSNRTSTRDLLGDIAKGLRSAGIRFMLYYQTGPDGTPDFWNAQQFPQSFTDTGTGDRSVFFDNWIKIITEMGNRYGTLLDGWFVDDGLIYYPAPFERMGQAARAGNPNRLICYNPWVATRHTDFQDVWMGEDNTGAVQFGSAAAGGNGVFTDGPFKGLLQHGMFRMEQDWGVHSPNMPIITKITAAQAISYVKSARQRNVPLSINLMMWNGGVCAPTSLEVLSALKKALPGSL